MDIQMLSRKRPPSDGWEEQTSFYTKKCVSSLNTWWDRNQSDTPYRATQHVSINNSWNPICVHEVPQRGKNLHDSVRLSEQTSSWSDTQTSVRKVLESLNCKRAIGDVSLSESVNKKFLEFHYDITGEFGSEDKQHSWAVLEKQEEVILYGPYFPNYSKGQHSEDIILKQTQELLESEGVNENWKVYIFTMNSPCLARNTNPCMLNLVCKAQEWWSLYGVKTHIGFVKCWGLKGNKENAFKDVTFRQVECINQSVDYKGYVETIKNIVTDLQPLCESVFCVVKNQLKSGEVDEFPLATTMQKQDRKSSYKSLLATFESKPEDERKMLMQEVQSLTEAADVLLSDRPRSLEEYLESGRLFILSYSFASEVCNALQDEMRLSFLQCWARMVQDMYAEFLREKLTEDFNHCTVQLFIKDALMSTGDYLQIGKVEFSEEDSKTFR